MGRCAARTPARGRRVFSLVPQLSQDACIVRPCAAHLDPYAQVHLALEQALEVLARGGRHRFQPLAALAEDDGLLAVALDEDRGFDAAQAAFFLEAVDRHFAAVGQLLGEGLEELLAQHLGGEEALVAIGQLVRGIGGRALGQRLGDDAQERRQVLAGLGAQGTRAENSRVFDKRSRYGIRSDLRRTMSILLTTATTCCPAGMRPSAAWSSGPKRSASTTKRTTSAWLATSPTRRLSALCSTLLRRGGLPGASTKTYWQSGPVRMPLMRWRVGSGRAGTIQSFSPTQRVEQVDFPGV